MPVSSEYRIGMNSKKPSLANGNWKRQTHSNQPSNGSNPSNGLNPSNGSKPFKCYTNGFSNGAKTNSVANGGAQNGLNNLDLGGIAHDLDSMETRWGNRRLFNIEKLEKKTPVFSPEFQELQRKMQTLQKTYRPRSGGHLHLNDAYDYLTLTIQNMRFNDFMSLCKNPKKLALEVSHLETVMSYLEKYLVLCDDSDCKQCGRKNQKFVELPDDLQDKEPFEEIDSAENAGEDLFEIVEQGLYPKYLYRLDVPAVTPRIHPKGNDAENLVKWSDPVKAGRCLHLRSNFQAQRFERWQIETGVLVFSPKIRERMKSLVQSSKNLSARVLESLKRIPIHLRRHEPFKCGTCYFETPRFIPCQHQAEDQARASKNCIDTFEHFAREMLDLEMKMTQLIKDMADLRPSFWDFLEWEVLGSKIFILMPFIFCLYIPIFLLKLVLEGASRFKHSPKRKLVF